jgi:hypothetical protein
LLIYSAGSGVIAGACFFSFLGTVSKSEHFHFKIVPAARNIAARQQGADARRYATVF